MNDRLTRWLEEEDQLPLQKEALQTNTVEDNDPMWLAQVGVLIRVKRSDCQRIIEFLTCTLTIQFQGSTASVPAGAPSTQQHGVAVGVFCTR